MTDTNKYRVWFSNRNFCNDDYKSFDTRSDLVNWLCEKGILHTNGTPRFVRITYNNKSGSPGKTGWVDGKTLLGLWQEVEQRQYREKYNQAPTAR
jgi:hypothetical protein